MIFDQEAFDAKVKKAVEAINNLSKEMEDSAKKAEELKKQVAEAKAAEAKAALKEKLNKAPAVTDPYSSVNATFAPNYTSSNYWTQMYTKNTVTGVIKQEFGKPDLYGKPKADWHESFDTDFNLNLASTVNTIYTDSYGDPKTALLGKKGKAGECYVFMGNGAYNKYGPEGKSYVWHEPYAMWFKVPYSMVIDHWNDLQNQKNDHWSSGGWNSTGYIQPKYDNITLKTMGKSNIGVDKWDGFSFEPTAVEYDDHWNMPVASPVYNFPVSDPATDNLKNYYGKVYTKFVKQKTKPSNPKEGWIWSDLHDVWQIYVNSVWVKLHPTDKKICEEIIAEKKKPVAKAKVVPKTGSGLFFRGNCSNWHEVINPEENVVTSVNGKYKWFMSKISAEKEYNCGHDYKRVIPVFTEEEKAAKIKEISAKQNGQIDTTYYIQAGTGKNVNWGEIHVKQTIMVGGRAFHHNSGNKTWYMCLTFDEMKFAKMFKGKLEELYQASPWTKDRENIFIDAFPVGQHGFAWFYDGTKPSAQSSIDSQKEQILDSVQEIANNLVWNSKMEAKNKNKSKDMPDPKTFSDYQLDDSDLSAYMSVFDHIYDDVYSFPQFKSKAFSLHKFLMHDIKLAMLKKNKVKFIKLTEALDILQAKYQEAEQYHVMQNKHKGLYLKQISKVQTMFHYHYDNDYGVSDS